MSREKKSKVDDVIILRRILDDSSDPVLDSLLTKEDKALESIRRRLSQTALSNHVAVSRSFPRTTSMEPRIFIHERIAPLPCSVPLQSVSESPITLPEFEFVSFSLSSEQVPALALSFDTEDLFEVEKVKCTTPEFIEVTPKEPLQTPLQRDITIQNDGTVSQAAPLPEWLPVINEQETNILESYEQQKAEEIPEFGSVTFPQVPESMETKKIQEPSVDFLPVEQTDSSFQMLSRQQIRRLKRTQRKKEKEAKKLQRIEQKRLKKESRKQQNEEEQPLSDQFSVLPTQEETPTPIDTIEPIQSIQKKVFLDGFEGIECIDEKIAEILYKNGYFSIENLKEATIDDLVEIRGIKRKLAKQIKKEISQKNALPPQEEFIPMKQIPKKKKSAKELNDTAEWESYPTDKKIKKRMSPAVCTYKEYTLYKKIQQSTEGKKTTIHFFSIEKPKRAQPTYLPEGYRIAINKKTGIPFLKKKR